jgi:tripartite-type tricarboxylate transporter receptor subunit TctC
MKMMKIRGSTCVATATAAATTATAAAAALLALQSPLALAQAWPAKPIRMIIPFPPGGATDLIGRLSAQRLTETLGQPVLVENRGGAGGSIGTELGMRSAPDGYTLTFSVASYAVNPSLYKLAFDPVKDIQPIIQLSRGPLLIAAHPSLPIRSVRDLVALARKNPGGVNFSTTGQGTISHLATEHFMAMAGVRMTHIPYKGTGPALTDTVAGHVSLTFGNVFATLPLARAGKLRAIAVTSAQRIAGDTSIPTIAESGVPGYEIVLWHGLLGPRGLPRPIVERLNGELNRTLQTKEMIDRLEGDGLSAAGGTPEAFGERISKDIALYRGIVMKAGIKVD